MNEPLVLVVDDEKAHRLMIGAHLEDAGYRVIEAGDGEKALALADEKLPDLVLMDLVMPRLGGMEALGRLKSRHPDLPVLMMTAYGSIESAVAALKTGAEDYLAKPLDMDEVLIKVGRQLQGAALRRQVTQQAERLGERFDFSALVGQSPPMLALKETLAMVAPAEATVLVTGPSGTGKEVAAQIIHQNSARSAGPLIKVNCAALPETLLESELFGHEKGAFTGATARRLGRFGAANGGTIFLDEIGEIPPHVQAKLLRVLQDGEYTPLGADHGQHTNARVLAATNRDLAQAVATGEFREDLYYRLNVVHVVMPPLRARGEDIMLLAERFLDEFNRKNRREVKGFSPAARKLMLAYAWPGNVRELVNAVERSVIMTPGDYIQPENLPPAMNQESHQEPCALRAGMTIKEAERRLIEATLEATGGNRTQSADLLGVTRKTLQNKIKEYGLPPAD